MRISRIGLRVRSPGSVEVQHCSFGKPYGCTARLANIRLHWPIAARFVLGVALSVPAALAVDVGVSRSMS
jgi:hypothetical protein